jgi:M6 family metalloprotease-like protein
MRPITKRICPHAAPPFAILGLLLFLTTSSFGAPLRDVPQRLVQPDGEILECFASGDEYHNWLHDAMGFTILRDPASGYYVYADEIAGALVPTGYIAGRVDPAAAGLQPGANIDAEVVLRRREAFNGKMARDERFDFGGLGKSAAASASRSELHNLVVFLRFSDEDEYTGDITPYDSLFNSPHPNELSLYNYYKEVSYGTLEISSSFYPVPIGTTIVSYQDSEARSYYQPYHETENPNGFDPDASWNDPAGRTLREHTLLMNAIAYVENEIPASLNLDADNDGYIDCVSFIVSGGPDGWNTLLWPHRWVLWAREAFIQGKRVWDYTFQLHEGLTGSGLRLGTVAHEMFHILGAPDLYHYSQDGLNPVGPWDLMAFTYNIPQHMGAYMKHLYGGWIDEIPVITISGTYELAPLSSEGPHAFRIPSPHVHNEFFLVEYRKKETPYEAILPGEGLIVYRINIDMEGIGNRIGPPDEVYVYRPGGAINENGEINSAHMGSHVGRTDINDGTDPWGFLSDGTIGGLSISNIGAPGETIAFDVGIDFVPPVILQYDAGTRYWGFGSGYDPKDFQVAIRLPAAELTDRVGQAITHVRLYLQSGGGTDATVCIWEGGSYGDPGTLVYEKSIADRVTLDQWTVHELDSPVEIKSANEYWVGYRINSSGGWPAGIDGGPMVPGRGAWINWTGSWQILTGLNPSADYNFRIRAVTGGIVTGVEPVAGIPVNFNLYQNYPNPFNPSTIIRYSLPESGRVRLDVFNALGQLVERAVDDVQTTGFYEVRFDGSHLPSGVYYYRLRLLERENGGDSFMQTRRFVLVK